MKTENARPRSRGKAILGTVTTIGIVIAMPIWLPATIVLGALHTKRQRKAAASFKCGKCGGILGDEALKNADKVWADKMRELQERKPGVRNRTVRTVHAICAACGVRYRFDDKGRTFVVEKKG